MPIVQHVKFSVAGKKVYMDVGRIASSGSGPRDSSDSSERGRGAEGEALGEPPAPAAVDCNVGAVQFHRPFLVARLISKGLISDSKTIEDAESGGDPRARA